MIKIGKIVGIFGIKGEMKFQSYCDDFSSFLNIKKVYNDDVKEYSLTYLKPHKNIGILKLEGFDRIEQAEKLIGQELFAHLELGEDEYFLSDIIGFFGVSTDGDDIGELKEIHQFGSKLVYEFNGGILVPSEFVKRIDFTNEQIIIEIIEGLLDINSLERR